MNMRSTSCTSGALAHSSRGGRWVWLRSSQSVCSARRVMHSETEASKGFARGRRTSSSRLSKASSLRVMWVAAPTEHGALY